MSIKSKIKGINDRIKKAKTLLLSNQQKLNEIKGKLRTSSQKQKYLKISKKHKSNVSAYRKVLSRIKKLKSILNKVKKAGSRIRNAGRKIRSYFQRRRGLNDVGVVPIIAAGALAAGILVALGSLIQKNITLKEELDALNEELDTYEPEYDEYENGYEDDYEEEDEWTY